MWLCITQLNAQFAMINVVMTKYPDMTDYDGITYYSQSEYSCTLSNVSDSCHYIIGYESINYSQLENTNICAK